MAGGVWRAGQHGLELVQRQGAVADLRVLGRRGAGRGCRRRHADARGGHGCRCRCRWRRRRRRRQGGRCFDRRGFRPRRRCLQRRRQRLAHVGGMKRPPHHRPALARPIGRLLFGLLPQISALRHDGRHDDGGPPADQGRPVGALLGLPALTVQDDQLGLGPGRLGRRCGIARPARMVLAHHQADRERIAGREANQYQFHTGGKV